VVLQGGGALGAYECGALNAMLELTDEFAAQGHEIVLKVVTGVSIGSINAACVVGAKSNADARARLNALWDDLTLETPPDGGLVDNTPLGLAIDAFSTDPDIDRMLVVMNLYPLRARLPRNLAAVEDRMHELSFGNRLRQDRTPAWTHSGPCRKASHGGKKLAAGGREPLFSP
jgi:predicted acylesterase/phospholipase RssA